MVLQLDNHKIIHAYYHNDVCIVLNSNLESQNTLQHERVIKKVTLQAILDRPCTVVYTIKLKQIDKQKQRTEF